MLIHDVHILPRSLEASEVVRCDCCGKPVSETMFRITAAHDEWTSGLPPVNVCGACWWAMQLHDVAIELDVLVASA